MATEKNKKRVKLKPPSFENRKARFEYTLLDEYNCGIKLLGSEIKSIRNSNASISEAYCYMNKGELFIKNMHIAEYKDSIEPHEPLRDRKLLLTKKEILKIEYALKTSGMTLVPTYMYFRRGLVKLKVRLAKGKKLYDKRESIKKKDVERDLRREGM
jgi:SsrA-binding protein